MGQNVIQVINKAIANLRDDLGQELIRMIVAFKLHPEKEAPHNLPHDLLS
ncbi:hypothetical protein NBRC3293_1499 [Gluconobacter oxydans NBRC 3293]|uniref:Uncharacterized protein n=1 Tax=Gluconobacter oxydans NBRC 3293 TaxID=1315969 RepID=A0A829X1R2_GLUOY|nr:hypothetical protein NBRC3293_1499 [Gluconobacter oxydans NBRC 3293]